MFMNTENSKASEPPKVVVNLSQRLDLKSLNKHVALQNLSIYYTLKHIRQQCKNNKLKIIAPTRNNELELRDGLYSVSDIQYYIKYIMNNNVEALSTNSPIHIYINRINNRLVFKKQDDHKLE